jgi:hypothetical protein
MEGAKCPLALMNPKMSIKIHLVFTLGQMKSSTPGSKLPCQPKDCCGFHSPNATDVKVIFPQFSPDHIKGTAPGSGDIS